MTRFGQDLIEFISESGLIGVEASEEGSLVVRWSPRAAGELDTALARHLRHTLSRIGEAGQCSRCGESVYLCRSIMGGGVMPVDTFGRWHWSLCAGSRGSPPPYGGVQRCPPTLTSLPIPESPPDPS